ncbi:MAG TPA: hypothetical protein VK249_32485 [Anaerolineales bacterium]|nr:hypothetical protein [Anaerolineales bacterium]
MRGPSGYGGPVAHWWQQSLMYAGTGLDWRYEGIIIGYLQLWERTNDAGWLIKARRAGDDLLSGQLEDYHFAASAFELNPASAGTPHEAACDAGLLRLALALREAGYEDWEKYATCAERNLRMFYIEQLWDIEAQSFRDDTHVPSFVPNKAATACEALFLLTKVTGNTLWVERYAMPTLDRILEHQVQDRGLLDGAIAQNSFGERKVEKYFPVYIARCIPALLRGFIWVNKEQYAESALRAMQFIARWVSDDGSFPTVIYGNRRVNRYPSWIAALGDILRAAEEMRPYGFDADLSSTEHRLLAGQDASGGIQTATGFAAQASGRDASILDLRDVLHVAGWCDKAFRYLTSSVGIGLPASQSSEFEVACIFRGQQLYLVETPETLEIFHQQDVCYRWRKGEPWPEVASEELWLH